MRTVRLVMAGVVLAAALAGGGFALGIQTERRGTASFEELQAGIATALGVPVDEVHSTLDPWYRTRCQRETCRQIMYDPVPPPGTDLQQRLDDAGWTLHNHDAPECVSDNPGVLGWVCSYQRGDVTVSIQVESPESPDELYLWASTG